MKGYADGEARGVIIGNPFSEHAGYAISSLLEVFTSACAPLVPAGRMFVCHGEESRDAREWHRPVSLTGFPWRGFDPEQLRSFCSMVRGEGVDLIFGLDFPVKSAAYNSLRAAGVRTIISYLGAPSGTPSRGLRLLVKRLNVARHCSRPDHFIYESEAMRHSGTHGRGIPRESTSVVPLGTDTDRFRPMGEDEDYAFATLRIPQDREIVFYSGHFDERKGVRTIIDAAIELVDRRGRKDVHFLLVGNQANEAEPYARMLSGTSAEHHVTFGGYRSDLHRLHHSCSMGVIASVGWDSLTLSAIEMQSSGLPLIVSNLQGLPEAIEAGESGLVFEPGDAAALASQILAVLDQPAFRAVLSRNARARAVRLYGRARQIAAIQHVVSQTIRRAGAL